VEPLQNLFLLFNDLWTETDGQDLVEYSLLLAFIAISTISILTGVKSSSDTLWDKISNAMSSAATSAS
jgi:Flp pilus assembly pilin Flp